MLSIPYFVQLLTAWILNRCTTWQGTPDIIIKMWSANLRLREKQRNMARIVIDDTGHIECDGKPCDPLGYYATCAECGNCRLIALCTEFMENHLEGVY